MIQILSNYSYSASLKTLILEDLIQINLFDLQYIKNITTGRVYYNIQYPTAYHLEITNNHIKFSGNQPLGSSDSDVFLIRYNFPAEVGLPIGGGSSSLTYQEIAFGDIANQITSSPNFTWDGSALNIISTPGTSSGWGNIQEIIHSAGSEAGISLNNTGTGGLQWNLISTNNSSGIGGAAFSIGDATNSINYFYLTAGVVQLPTLAGSGSGIVAVDNSGNLSFASASGGTVTSVDITPGTGISATGGPITTSGSITVTNTAPDQTVVLNSGTGISVTGTYPTFTITNTSPSTVVPSALTKTDDSNVTLTLGGTPATSLLQAVSLTLGWTGTLAPVRGGTGVDTSSSTGVAQVSSGTWSVSATLANNTLATTQSAGDNSTKLATTAYVDTGLGLYLPIVGRTYTTTTGNGLALTTSTLTTGNLVSLASTGTAAGSNTQTVLNIATSGANGTSTQTTYGLQLANTHTGTSSTNVGLLLSASGGTVNYALLVTSGSSGFGTSTPSSKVDITTTALGTTQTTSSGLALVNTTSAAVGAQQISPAMRWSGNGWNTGSGGSSQTADFRVYVLPVQGVAQVQSSLVFQGSVNGAAYTTALTMLDNGTLTTGAGLTVSGNVNCSNSYIGSNATSSPLIIGNGTGTSSTPTYGFRSSNTGTGMFSSTLNILGFSTGGTERLRIDTVGSVYIGAGTANTSALLDVPSTTKGFLPPRMTTAQKTAIGTPAAGLIVYDTDLAKLCVYTTAWEVITSA